MKADGPAVAATLLLAVFINTNARAAEVGQTLGRRVTVSGDRLVVTEPDDNRIAVYDISGAALRKVGAFGTVGSSPAEVQGPHGAGFDPRGRLYVADTFNHRVQVFDVAGLERGRMPRLLRFFGNFGRAAGDLRAPQAPVAFSSLPALAGLAFVVDTRNDRVQVFDAFGVPTGRMFGGTGAAEGKLDGVVGAAFDSRGRVLYVAESTNRRVSAFDAAAGAFLFAFGSDLESPGGIAVDSAGVVHVTDVGARLVRRYAPVRGAAGLVTRAEPAGRWGRAGTGAGEWTYPHAIAVDGRGRVYVTDLADDRGQVFTAAGDYVGRFGEDVEPIRAAEEEPAPPALPATICSNAETFSVTMRAAPETIPVGTLVDLEVEIAEGCKRGRPAGEGVQLRVDAIMRSHGHGMNTRPRTTPLGRGRFAVSGLRFHMPGRWEIYFDLVRGRVLERAQAAVTID